MSKTIIVGGFGPGISNAVAERFGAEGFSVALVARNEGRLAAGVSALASKGVKAAAFPTDLGDVTAVRALVANVREKLGPITVLHWNAYPVTAGDLLTADPAALHSAFDLAVGGLVAAVQASLADLRSGKDTAILVTNGGLGYFDPAVDAMAAQYDLMGIAVGNAAKHKTVGLLAQKLKGDGIYVGEIMVTGAVKGTAFDTGSATLDPKDIAQKFWDLYRARSETYAKVG
ncbi:MAG: SDR family NAD(P)-dependent oxidoreductase [Labilithrix sp.]|nr:SDR family NAD(P)-dependent oxidoreductase [Labilithrix sp.]